MISNISTVVNILENLSQLQKSEIDGKDQTGALCLLQNWALGSIQGPHCRAYWDDVYCWPATPTGQNVTLKCAKAMAGAGQITRFCLQNESWYFDETTDYTTCLPQQTYPVVVQVWPIREIIQYTLFIGSVLSLVFLIAALFIFFRFKSIRCDRITIHIHFMVALSIKSCVLILISDPTPFSDTYYYRDVDWICKLVILIQLYSYVASTNWMLIQGHFLNSKLSTDIFQRNHRIKIYCSFGWGFPLILTLIWLVVMEHYHNVPCWRKHTKTGFVWIIAAPVLAALLINLIFLGNIIRILLKKVQISSNAREVQQFRRVSKATAGLFPLLGINNLIFFFNPGGNWVVYYMMTNAVLQPLQGILVPVLYCFICREVHDCVRREFGKFSAQRSLTTTSSSVRYYSGRINSRSSNQRVRVESGPSYSPNLSAV